jgi:hypothetical protein
MAVVKTMLSSSGCRKWTPTMGAVVSDRQKVLAAISFLDTSPRRSYNTKVKRDGEFLTYDTFKEWMTAFYATPDVANNACMKYENCKQREGETVESYFLRHRRNRRQFG